MNSVEQAERAGFDLSLADENLRCSYEQRALQHQEALALALELERIGQELRDRTQPTAHRVRDIGLEDIILAKEALGREKDLLAVKELRAILEKTRR